MSLEQINEQLEKLTSTQYEFAEIAQELDIEEEDLTTWIDAFEDLQPSADELNQKLFSNQQFTTLKKIKKLIYEENYDIEQLKKILQPKTPSKKSTKSTNTKKHYFETNSQQNSTESNDNNQLVINFNINEQELIENNSANNNIDQDDSKPENIDFTTNSSINSCDNSFSASQSQSSTQDISNQTGDFDIYNKIDPSAKIKDFSNIKLYNIHPKLKEQLVHRLKCLNLNVEELSKILKNL